MSGEQEDAADVPSTEDDAEAREADGDDEEPEPPFVHPMARAHVPYAGNTHSERDRLAGGGR